MVNCSVSLNYFVLSLCMLIYSYFLTRKSYFHSTYVYQEPSAFVDNTGQGAWHSVFFYPLC